MHAPGLQRFIVGADPVRPSSAVLCGLGTCLPEREVSNAELASTLDTTDEWIRTRTGIRARRRSAPDVDIRDLAHAAGLNALASADATQVDLVVLATTTPARPCPAGAPEVATRLGLSGAAAFDIAAVCSGFVYGLATAAGLIVSGVADSALVIAAETYSRIVDPTDRSTAVIFGDGAGAVVLRRGQEADPGALLAWDLGSDGTGCDLIQVPAHAAHRGAQDGQGIVPGYFTMAGRPVYLQAIERMAGSCRQVTAACSWNPADVQLLVPHQANARIIRGVADRLGIAEDRAVCAIEEVGNTSAASIPLALATAARQGRLKAGARTVLTAFGGGLTWGSVAMTGPSCLPIDSEI
ncbi:beta-ketoacyl-ACP synthase III [Streptomyces shenzhenensis]|uniref:beta-ketoacyl-ACP synthase III n=1 Tax=Streptomyces shenzhenensis TaxID=943815 RepID=UPI0033DD24ED